MKPERGSAIINMHRAILTAILLASCIRSFKIEPRAPNLALIPKAKTILNPFFIQADPTELFALLAYCPESSEEFIHILSSPNLCENLTIRGTASELNSILAHFTIATENMKGSESMSIVYFVSGSNNPRQVKKFVQNLSVLTQIPIILSKDVILYDIERSANLSEHLLQIDSAYISLRDTAQFKLEIEDTEIPSWLNFELINDDLVLKGKPDQKTTRDLILSFRIVDESNGLKSMEIRITIAFVLSSSSNTLFAGFVTFFTIIICLVIVLAVVCVLKSKAIVEKSMMIEQVKKQDELEEQKILTDSIVHWNNATQHKLMTHRISIMGLIAQDRTTINDSMHELEILKHDLGSGHLLEPTSNENADSGPQKLIPTDEFEDIWKVEESIQKAEIHSPGPKQILSRPSLN